MGKYSMIIKGTCIVPGCEEAATRVLNIRMRRRDTGAEFGPNIDPAVFCSQHADYGADVDISFIPNRSGYVRFNVNSGGPAVTYLHSMRGGNPGQESIL